MDESLDSELKSKRKANLSIGSEILKIKASESISQRSSVEVSEGENANKPKLNKGRQNKQKIGADAMSIVETPNDYDQATDE